MTYDNVAAAWRKRPLHDALRADLGGVATWSWYDERGVLLDRYAVPPHVAFIEPHPPVPQARFLRVDFADDWFHWRALS